MIVLLYLLDTSLSYYSYFYSPAVAWCAAEALYLLSECALLSSSKNNVPCKFVANVLDDRWSNDRRTAATIAVRRGDLLAVLKGVNEISQNTIFRCQRKDQLKSGLGHLQKSSLTGGFKDIAKQIARLWRFCRQASQFQSISNSVLIDNDSAKVYGWHLYWLCPSQPTPAVIGLQIALISPTLNTRPLYLYLTCTFTNRWRQDKLVLWTMIYLFLMHNVMPLEPSPSGKVRCVWQCDPGRLLRYTFKTNIFRNNR